MVRINKKDIKFDKVRMEKFSLLLYSYAHVKTISYLGVLLCMPFEVGFLPTRELTDLTLMPFVVQMNCINVVLEVVTLRHFYGTIWTLCLLDPQVYAFIMPF